MNCDDRNRLFLQGDIDRDDAWPKITLICETPFETEWVRALNLKDFLLAAESDLYFDSDRSPWRTPD
jgi:hypothetical protein